MFRFRGFLGRKRFARAAAIRVGLFAACLFGFPFILWAVGQLTNCRSVGGACGAVALMTSAAVKPLVSIVFVFSFVGIALRRARDAGLPAWIGLFIPLLLVADAGFLIFFGAHWSFAFSAGVLRGAAPLYVAVALICIAALSLLPSRDTAPGSRNPFGPPGMLAFALGIAIAAFAAMNAAALLPGLAPVLLPATRILWQARPLVPFAMAGFAVALAWIAWRSYRSPPAVPTRAESLPPPPSPHRLPIIAVAVMASILTFGAVAISMRSMMAPLAFVYQLHTVLPTFALYFCFLLASYFAAVKRDLRSIAFVALAALPFVLWANAYWTTVQDLRREAAEIAAIPTITPMRLPTTLVFESQQSLGMQAAWSVRGIERVIAKGSDTSRMRLIQYERGTGRSAQRTDIASLPDSYLHLRVGRASAFAKPRQVYAATGGPLELRLVEPGRDELIAVWYRAYNPLPTLPPFLTVLGWYRGSNTANSDAIADAIREFLAKAVPPAS